MKILIVTQVIDKNHPILGFFHRWVEEFAVNCEEVHVICLQKGEYTFPNNVYVYSLGKEEGKGHFTYLWRFYKYIWQLRKKYDNVFIHMNQIYVILGSLLWRLQRKKVGLWYMHGSTSLSLHIAEKVTDYIFTGSSDSFRLPSKKVLVTGHGIDTERFSLDINMPKTIDLITVGRITKSKNILKLVDLLAEVRKTEDVTLTIVGEPLSEEDAEYKIYLETYAKNKQVEDSLIFMGMVSNEILPPILQKSRVFVHTATNGSLDKALLEPLAVGTPVITMAVGAKSLPLEDWLVDTPEDLAKKVLEVLQSDVSYKTGQLEVYVQKNHSILSLIPKICKQYGK